MPAKKKYSDDIKEKAYALSMTGMAGREIARTLSVPETTVRGWLGMMPQEQRDEAAHIRAQKKLDFIDDAWSLVGKAIKLADKRITRALEHEEELDALIDEIDMTSADEMDYRVKTALINKVRTLEIQSVRELSTLIGTMYDKAALAAGESTLNAGFDVRITVVD